MNWTDGYASDIPYTAGYYGEQRPILLNFVCMLQGFEPVDLAQGFTYCELGFGRGLTANVLAAAYPKGQFYAADFNPGHVSGARALANSARLDNLHLLEASFEELAAGGEGALPQFDFITLHGIYTWVNADNQAHIAAFIKRYLKPGGVVYVSYNAMPGWTDALPMQRLLWQYAQAHPGGSEAQIRGAGKLMAQMAELKAGYFLAHPELQARVQDLREGNSHYLVHEYMHKHWQPVYHADVVERLAGAKLDYVGSADLPLNYLPMFLDEARLALLAGTADPVLRETMKDCFFNTRFRKDVFVRGARKMSLPRQMEVLGAMRLSLTVERSAANLTIKLPYGEVRGKAEVYEPVLDALADGPRSLSELRAVPGLAGLAPSGFAEAASLLSASGQVALSLPAAAAADTAPARRLNRAIAHLARYSADHGALCAPLLGGGLPCSQVDLLAYDALARTDQVPTAEALARSLWPILASQGRCMQRNGQNLATEADNLEELRLALQRVIETRLPVWRGLGLM